MSPNTPDSQGDDEVLPNSAADEFFGRMKHDFRRPKPNEQAIASALQAVQKLTGEFPVEHSLKSSSQTTEEKCPKCGAQNSSTNRFCGYCGALMEHSAPARSNGVQAGSEGQHVYHHHYHHHIFDQSEESPVAKVGDFRWSTQQPQAVEEPTVEEEEHTDSADAVQKLVQNWSRWFNSQRLDELVDLYSSDSIVLRPNMAPAHGSTAVRQLLEGAINAGIGDLQLDCADIGIVGDFACLTGRSRMLVPTAPAKRQEATGKYLIVVRRESGEWKIVADSWCMDSAKAPAASTSAPVVPMRQRK